MDKTIAYCLLFENNWLNPEMWFLIFRTLLWFVKMDHSHYNAEIVNKRRKRPSVKQQTSALMVGTW